MKELLDDEIINFEGNQKITFLNWWEGKRVLFNRIVLILGVIAFFMSFESISNTVKFFIYYFFFVNIVYAIFSLISYIFNLLFNNKLSFLQNKMFWGFLFVIQILIAILGLLVIIGGRSVVAPMPNPTIF